MTGCYARGVPLSFLALIAQVACHGASPSDTATATDADADTDTDTDTDTAPPDPATVPLAGSCPADQLFGAFGVESDGLLTVASGAVADGVVPLTVLEEVSAEGDCRLLRRVSLFCDPACSPDQTCGFDGECIPYPAAQDLGIVTVEGLFDPVEMTASSPGFTYYQLGLPSPAYDPGALITLQTEGGALPPFTLYGVGIVPLEIVAEEWVLSEVADLEVHWASPGGPVRSRLHVRITIDQHGASPIQLDCDFPDTGTGTLPSALMAEFVASGVTGFPAALVTRQTVDSTVIGDGCVEFAIAWSGAGEIRVEGYTPCTQQADCPTGQICNTDLEICE